MNDMMKKLMEKKRKDGEPLPKDYKESKMGVLKALHDEMGKMAGGDIAGLKKVTVAAPDEAGLKEGLDKAKEVVDSAPDALDAAEEEDPYQDMKNDIEEFDDADKIEEMIKLLQEKKTSLSHKV